MVEGKFTLRIFRGDPGNQYWEEFEFERKEGLNIISCLMEIQQRPFTKAGVQVAPVVWEQACLEEVCGSCTALVNGVPRQICTALIEVIIKSQGGTTITLAPLTKFPLVRDLIVDRSPLFEDLKKIKAWVPVDRLYKEDFGPPISPTAQEAMYIESTCMSCACCMEACPQYNNHSKFVGPAVVNQVKLHNAHPTGKAHKKKRLEVMMDTGGISECGNAQNCSAVCPKNIPLTKSIAQVGKECSRQAFKNVFSAPEEDKDL